MGGTVAGCLPWLLSPPAVGGAGAFRNRVVQERHGRNRWAAGHARWVWSHSRMLVGGMAHGPVGHARLASVDLEFLAALGRHETSCRACRSVAPGDTTTPEQWLWRAVREIPRLRVLVDVLDKGKQNG